MASKSALRRVLELIGEADGREALQQIAEYYELPKRGTEAIVKRVCSKLKYDLSALVSADGPWKLDRWSALLKSQLGETRKRSYEEVLSELEAWCERMRQLEDAGKFESDSEDEPEDDAADDDDNNATSVTIFISHSAKDATFTRSLVECLESCLEVPDKTIRCTSVPGYKLAPGDVSEAVLRENLEQCLVVVGLLTSESLNSGFVIMELGAAWGLKKTTCALLAPDVKFERMPGPLSRLHAVKADDPSDILDVIEVIARKTGMRRRNPARTHAAVSAFVAATRAKYPHEGS